MEKSIEDIIARFFRQPRLPDPSEIFIIEGYAACTRLLEKYRKIWSRVPRCETYDELVTAVGHFYRDFVTFDGCRAMDQKNVVILKRIITDDGYFRRVCELICLPSNFQSTDELEGDRNFFKNNLLEIVDSILKYFEYYPAVAFKFLHELDNLKCRNVHGLVIPDLKGIGMSKERRDHYFPNDKISVSMLDGLKREITELKLAYVRDFISRVRCHPDYGTQCCSLKSQYTAHPVFQKKE